MNVRCNSESFILVCENIFEREMCIIGTYVLINYANKNCIFLLGCISWYNRRVLFEDFSKTFAVTKGNSHWNVWAFIPQNAENIFQEKD